MAGLCHVRMIAIGAQDLYGLATTNRHGEDYMHEIVIKLLRAVPDSGALAALLVSMLCFKTIIKIHSIRAAAARAVRFGA